MRGAFDPNSFDNASLPSMFNPQKKLAFQHGPFWAFIGPFCFVSHLLRDSLPKLQSSTGISGHASKLTKKVFLETSGPKVPGFRGRVSANNVCTFWATLAYHFLTRNWKERLDDVQLLRWTFDCHCRCTKY